MSPTVFSILSFRLTTSASEKDQKFCEHSKIVEKAFQEKTNEDSEPENHSDLLTKHNTQKYAKRFPPRKVPDLNSRVRSSSDQKPNWWHKVWMTTAKNGTFPNREKHLTREFYGGELILGSTKNSSTHFPCSQAALRYGVVAFSPLAARCGSQGPDTAKTNIGAHECFINDLCS